MIRITRTAFLVLGIALATTAVRAQSASFSVIGTACSAPSEPTPAIAARGLPRIGTSFDVTYAGPNRTFSSAQQIVQPFLITGLALSNPALMVPVGLLPQQPAGCLVYVQPDLVLAMPIDASGASFVSSVTLSIPNQPALVGATWFHQWFAVMEQCGIAGCNMAWVITSDAAIVQAGV